MTLQRAELGYYDDEDPGEPTTGKPRLSITDLEAGILTAAGAGRYILEIGTGLGVSTRALARFAFGVTTIDIDPWVHDHVWPSLPDNVFCTTGRFKTHAPVVFIDGDHSTEAVIADIEFARSLEPELIILHDAKYDNVRRAIEAVMDNFTIIDTEHGICLGK